MKTIIAEQQGQPKNFSAPIRSRGWFLLLFCLWLMALTPAHTTAGEERELILWVHPYLPATELVSRFTPLADYLAAGLDRPVNIRIQQSYQSHLDFVGRDQADLAFMGPASYVTMRRRYGDKPLLAMLEEDGSPFFQGMIIVRQDSPFRELDELQGQTFAFGDPHSTMSYLVPRAMLARAGISLTDLGRHDFLNSHHDVALAVLGGYFAAGGVKDEVFFHYRQRGLRVLAVSPLIPDHLFLTRRNLDPVLVAQLRELLMAINEHPDRRLILTSIKPSITGLQPAAPQHYNELATMTEGFDDH
ncbi:phosphate/phosphite/phosphonate ABC transporter substrate-binding protein [Desulfurivibrio dismutans]|uniref:phosphate/phosphite/phosphonate ABC transporter substrate-binding protein n=1 Tax=Desulfurivibrio dismutans TaxID=1398908 RepID=UPI0023DADB4A|nr:phosphate/phosphite/phosphonate ABC transporter substrate-binding protein [Desulfurivibrio alkaliphilus]MDF1613553.1 phosphate/phosphite/phosphonate ABC transporter substrate-binding protein [Desulfurivibrio alkaliphilus]